MLLYFIRSAQELKDVYYASPRNLRLSLLGELQAGKLAQFLSNETFDENSLLFTSPMQNALLTCKPISETLSLTAQVWQELHVCENQDCHKLPAREILRLFPGYVLLENKKPLDIRSTQSTLIQSGILNTANAVMHELKAMHKNGAGAIILISHNALIRTVLSILFKTWLDRLAHASITEVAVDTWEYPHIVLFNSIQHLRETEITY